VASDVYALGVLLFKLLTGADPYRLRERSPADLGELILAAEPDTPSAYVRRLQGAEKGTGGQPTVRELSGQRSTQPTALVRALAGNLDAIMAKALRKEPQNRYASAEQMADDLRRHLAGGRLSASYRPRASRRWWVVQGVVFALLLAAAMVALVLQSARIAEMQASAQNERQRYRQLANSFQLILEDSTPSRELINRAIQRIRQDLARQPATQTDLLMTLGRSGFNAGLFDEAATAVQLSLEIRLQLFGATHEKVAESLTALAEIEAAQGNYDASEALHRQSLAMLRKLHPEDDLDVAASLVGLGRVLLADGHAAHAEPLLQEAVKMQRRLLGEGDFRVAETLDTLGHTVDHLGSPSAAVALFQQAGKTQRRAAGNESWELAVSLVDQAAVLFELGRREEGISLLREVADIEKRRCGDERKDLARSLLNVAAAAIQGTPAAPATLGVHTVVPLSCQMPPLAVPHLTYLIEGVGRGLTALGDAAEARLLLRQIGESSSGTPPQAAALVPDSAQGSSDCVPDGGFATSLERPCCSGVIAGGTEWCRNPGDWGSTWRTCRHICGSRLVNGCVPTGGVTDTLAFTACCSGGAVTGSTRCLNQTDWGTTWRTCIHRCS
jgi:serine/threonine-protein kinase